MAVEVAIFSVDQVAAVGAVGGMGGTALDHASATGRVVFDGDDPGRAAAGREGDLGAVWRPSGIRCKPIAHIEALQGAGRFFRTEVGDVELLAVAFVA